MELNVDFDTAYLMHIHFNVCYYFIPFSILWKFVSQGVACISLANATAPSYLVLF